jgi:hypothetical protein
MSNNAEKKIENADVEDYLFTGMWSRKNSDSPTMACCTGPVSSGAVKGLARVRVRQTKRRKRMGRVAGCNRRGVSSRSRTQGNSSIYCEFLISVNLLQQQ